MADHSLSHNENYGSILCIPLYNAGKGKVATTYGVDGQVMSMSDDFGETGRNKQQQ